MNCNKYSTFKTGLVHPLNKNNWKCKHPWFKQDTQEVCKCLSLQKTCTFKNCENS